MKRIIGGAVFAAVLLLSNFTSMAAKPAVPPAKPAVPAIKITNPLPGLDRLGYGYNVFETEDYDPAGADMHDLTEKGEYDSYQMRGITYQKPISVQVMELGKTEAKWSTYTSVTDTQNAFSASMGIKGAYGPYSGSLQSSFSKAVHMASNTKIAMVNDSISGYEASLQDQEFLLKDKFQRDLQGDMAPQEIFQKYGTHMIQGILL